MKTIAYYLRNSTDIQEYQYQLENLDKRFNQFNNVTKLIYAEKISGFKNEKERPLMNQLLSDVDAGLINEIWVNDVTRLSRDAINMQVIVKHCQEKGVNIYFDEQNLNTLDNTGKADFTTTLLINILGQFAEANAKNFKNKGKQGKITKSKQGRYCGGLLPMGYMVEPNSKTKEIIVNESEAEIVNYIFNNYVNNGKSLLQIANDLNNLKVTDKKYNNKFLTHNLAQNALWRGSTIRHILKCKWYALGIGFFGGEEYPIKEELKFIDLDIYNKAQGKLISNVNNKKPHKHIYILNNLMYCDCGARMYGKVNGEKQTYLCGTTIKRESDKNFSCKIGKQIQIEQIENAVWLLIKNKLPEFQIEVESKSNKEVETTEFILKNNQLIDSIKKNSIENLKKQRQRTIDTFNKFGGDSAKLDSDIKLIDNRIKSEDKNILILKSENKKLEMSIQDIDIVEEINKNIETIESDKLLIKLYSEK
ncbi:MAG: recombinase family protein, partial [Paludibacter sp.]